MFGYSMLFDIDVNPKNFLKDRVHEVVLSLGVMPRGVFTTTLKAVYTRLVRTNHDPIIAFTASLARLLSNKAYQRQVELLERAVISAKVIIPMDMIGEVQRVDEINRIKAGRAMWLACFWMCRALSTMEGKPELVKTSAIIALHQEVSNLVNKVALV